MLKVAIAFTYKTYSNIHPDLILSQEVSCLCMALSGTKPNKCCRDIVNLTMHPSRNINPARKGERQRERVDLG